MGKFCVRLKKVEDLALDVITDAICKPTARKFISYYASFLKNMRGRSSRIRAKISTAKPERIIARQEK